jgi:hypothetical protein
MQWITLAVAIAAVLVAGVSAGASIKLTKHTETYVELTRDLAGEARITRQSQNPLIAFDLQYVSGSKLMVVAITNIGQGSARDVKLGLTFTGADTYHRTFTRALMLPGVTQWYQSPPPRGIRDVRQFQYSSDDELVNHYSDIILTGTMRNALDEELKIDDRIENLRTYLTDLQTAGIHTRQ